MSEAEAKNFLNPDSSLGESSTTGGYISPVDIQSAIGVIYSDMSPVIDNPSAWVGEAITGDASKSVDAYMDEASKVAIDEVMAGSLQQVATDFASRFGTDGDLLATGPVIETGAVGNMDADDIAEVKMRTAEYLRDYTAELFPALIAAIQDKTAPTP